MPSGGVSVRARDDGDPLDAVAQARREQKRQSAELVTPPPSPSPSRDVESQDARQDDDEDETNDGGAKRKKKQRQSEVAARKRIRDVIAEEEEEGEAVGQHEEEEDEAYVDAEEKQAEPEAEPRPPPRKKRASSEGDAPPRKKRASSKGDAPRKAKPRREEMSNGLRRAVRMWTKEEEAQLIAGVRKYGMGAWRKILEEGEDVFHTHRTNVDLKDKWKNLVRREAQFPARERRNRVARRTAARLSLSSQELPGGHDNDNDNVSVASSHDSTVNVEEMFPEVDEEEDASRAARRRSSSQGGEETVKLLICTDVSAPHMRSLSIVPRRCPTVSALKRELTRRLLDDSPLPTNLQLVSITSRRLLADLEALDECLERDGREFFLLYDP